MPHTPTAPLFDYEVRRTYPDKTTDLGRIGFSPSPEEACARACSGKPAGTTAAVVRVIQEHAPASTQLADLTESWEPEESPTAKGRRFVLRDRQGRVAASEYEGGHMLTAWRFLTADRPAAAWKTAATLAAFRQAIREEHAACRTEHLDDLFHGKPTRDRVRAFMQGARARDFVHHGSHTF
jgi:hypothetical protein